jgi:HSP20 family protein
VQYDQAKEDEMRFDDARTQQVPVKVYRSEDRLTIAAPMAGLEPEDITVDVKESRLILHGELRGLLKDDKEVILDEWNPGPYEREIDLPSPVDAEQANVTYNNGVLVISLPFAGQTRTARLTLGRVESAHGIRRGLAGRVSPR